MDPLRGVFVVVLGLLVAQTSCLQLAKKEWWETALVYQIWPRGFQDSNGDGEGDLKGIINRLDYLQDLGIDTIWLNPIYSSPLIDSGYDISDYVDINPLFGNLQHFDELIKEAHKRDLKVILDIVPNHSSDKHKWFELSTKNVPPYNDYYVWADGSTDRRGNRIPPNNWVSTYSSERGSAWTWDDTRKQWYYHKFHYSQPDLNLRNENVVQELQNVFKFWLMRDVDGFRINTVSYLYEDKNLRDEPNVGSGSHTSDLPENTALVYAFRSYIDEWVQTNNATSKLLIAEAYGSDNSLISFYGNDTHEGIPPFNFRFITSVRNTSTAANIKNVLRDWIEKIPNNSSTNWVISNHDNSRAASRIGLNRVDGLHMLSLLLPGQAFTYYGDEIAMLDRKMLWNETIDPMGCARTKEVYANYSRDPARTPMQWNSEISAGFSTSNNTYLPLHPNYVQRNVEVQKNDKQSNLNTYKTLAELRKNQEFTHGDYEFATLNNNRVLILKRFLKDNPIYFVVVNLGLREETVNLTTLYPNLEDSMLIVVASSNAVHVTEEVSAQNLLLTANAALVLKGTELPCECTTNGPETTTTVSSATTSSSILQLIINTSIVAILYNLSPLL